MKETLKQIEEEIMVATKKERLLMLFKKLVQLESIALVSDDKEVRQLGYKSQDLQLVIERKL